MTKNELKRLEELDLKYSKGYSLSDDEVDELSHLLLLEEAEFKLK